MKVLIFSVSNYDRDGRLRALVNIFCHIGEVSVITKYTPNSNLLRSDVNYYELTFINCLRLFKYFFNYMRRTSNLDFILIDNRKAAFFALLFYPIIRHRIVIYDMREFYLCEKYNSFRNKIGTYFESCFINLADLVLCANQQRARLAEVQHDLKAKPIAIENNRQIGGDVASMVKLEGVEEFKKIILAGSQDKERINFVSTDGFSIERRTLEIIEVCSQFPKKINLFIFGKNQQKAHKYIADHGLKNVVHLGSVDGNVLGELLGLMDVGFVVYGSHDLNNKYCASGKIYEFIHLGIPVVTSDNMPLRKITHNAGIGVTNKNIRAGVEEIIDNLEQHKARCLEFSKEMEVGRFELTSAEVILSKSREVKR